MAANIVSFFEHRSRTGSSAPAAPRLPLAEPAPTVVVATAALSVACRDMAVNLSTLMSHAEAACAAISKIGETADALIRTGADLREAAESFREDRDRTFAALAAEMAGAKPLA